VRRSCIPVLCEWSCALLMIGDSLFCAARGIKLFLLSSPFPRHQVAMTDWASSPARWVVFYYKIMKW
jgi:hypothetical protein